MINKIKPGLILKPWLHFEISVLNGDLKVIFGVIPNNHLQNRFP
jgi:hypothetical protein